MDQVYTDLYPSFPVLVVMIALWIALAVGNGFIARALRKNVGVWVALSVIPLVNYFFYIYIVYSVVLGVLNKLNALEGRMGMIDT